MIDKIITLDSGIDVYILNQVDYLDRKFVLVTVVDKETKKLSEQFAILELVLHEGEHSFTDVTDKEILLAVGKLFSEK
ncbi:MAG: hypothetical protein R3Y21_03725 [Mycoplasmatota bacterium]